MSLWHCDAELCSMKNPYVNYHSRKNACCFMAVPHHSMSIGQLWALLPPRGTTYTPLRGMFSHSLITSSYVVIYMFLRNSRSELRLVKVGRNALSMGFFGCFFAQCTNIVRPIAYKSHSTPFLNRPLDLTPVSWVCDKRCRRSSAPKFVRKKKNNNNN